MKYFLSISVIGFTACYNVYQLGNYLYQEYKRRYKTDKKIEKSDKTEEIFSESDATSTISKELPNTLDSTKYPLLVSYPEQTLTIQNIDQHGDAITTKDILDMVDSTKQQPSVPYRELMTTAQNNDVMEDIIILNEIQITFNEHFNEQSSSVSHSENIIE